MAVGIWTSENEYYEILDTKGYKEATLEALEDPGGRSCRSLMRAWSADVLMTLHVVMWLAQLAAEAQWEADACEKGGFF